MGNEWEELPFSEAVSINPKVSLTRGTTYPFVDMTSVNSDFRCAYESEEREFKGGGSRFQSGDTLLARITPCLENGKISRYCAPSGTVAHGSTEFIVIRGREGVSNTAYAYYLTKWEGVRGYAISQMTGTSGRQRVPTASLAHLDVPLPPLSEQVKVAEILGTLDDKIELNRRMNRTLEVMARAIFKAWFVDFEPIKAKAGGATSFGGMPQHVFGQLPDRFTDTELGPVPAGWEVRPLSDFVELIGGGTPKRKMANYWDGDIPWFSVRDAPNDGDVWVIDTEEKITHEGVENSSAKILKPGTSIISARGTVGRLALTAFPMSINQSCYGVTGRNGVGDFFVYFTLHHAVVELQQRTHGSVFDTITRKTFDGLHRVLPQPELLAAFEEAVGPYLMMVRENLFENGLLANTRDTLLPKLISGELRVPAAEGGADAV